MPAATILVIDDVDSERRLLEQMLAPEGYSVLTAKNGPDGLRTVRSARPDLVLMDIDMPVMDGYTACRTLKEDSATAAIPVLMVTGLDETEHIRKALHQGADGYIMKPLQRADVLDKIRELLGLAKAGKLPGRLYLKFSKKPGPPAPPSDSSG